MASWISDWVIFPVFSNESLPVTDPHKLRGGTYKYVKLDAPPKPLKYWRHKGRSVLPRHLCDLDIYYKAKVRLVDVTFDFDNPKPIEFKFTCRCLYLDSDSWFLLDLQPDGTRDPGERDNYLKRHHRIPNEVEHAKNNSQ